MSRIREVVEGIEGAVLIGLNLALGPVLRRGRIRWGATGDEVRQALPGDELVLHPKWSYTNAITVRATAAEVWPWLAQMGQGRGGFYSYEFLENLVGCGIHNADRILPEFQNLQVGDGDKLAAKMPGFPV